MTEIILRDKYRKIIKIYQRFILKSSVTQKFESKIEDLNLELDSRSDKIIRLMIDILVELYEDSFFLNRDTKWFRISKVVKDSIFENLKYFSSNNHICNEMAYLFMSLAHVKDNRREKDVLLDEVLQKTLNLKLIYTKKTKDLYRLWFIYVQSKRFNYLNLQNLVENAIIKLVPNFEGDNYKYLAGTCQFIYNMGIFYYLSDAKSEFKDNNIYRHCCNILQKTNWTLEKYIAVSEVENVPAEVIVEKIEERLFLLFDEIKKEERDGVIDIINNMFDNFSSRLYFLLVLYAKNSSYKSLGLRYFERLALKNGIKWSFNYFIIFDRYSCEEGLELMGNCFSSSYLKLKEMKLEDVVSQEDDFDLKSIKDFYIKKLILYIKSTECKKDLIEVNS